MKSGTKIGVSSAHFGIAPVKGKGHHYRIVGGERRFRALKLLQERGEVPEDFAVPVEI
jgi:hypothetical protein